MKILFAEDDKQIIELVVDALDCWGYFTKAVTNGEAIFEQLESGLSPDVIVTDNNMPPGVKGMEVLRRLRADERFKDIPVIVYSGDDDIEPEVKSLGGMFMRKSCKLDAFKKTLEMAASTAKGRR